MASQKPGRNDPCPCGSGKKYKQCCQSQHATGAAESRALPASIPDALRSGLTHHHAGRFAQAEAIYRQILRVAPNNADALNLLGALALRDGNSALAVDLLGRAVRFNQSNPEIFSNLGFALHEQGRLDAAAENYRKAIALDPNYAHAQFNLHALLLDPADMVPAIQCLRRVLAINPFDRDARYMLAVTLDYSGDAQAASAYFDTLEVGNELDRARLDGWRYLKSACRPLPRITGSLLQTFQLAFAAAPAGGLVLEFGVRHGNSIRQIAGLARQAVHGFDSFEGLPEAWHGEARGSYSTRGVMPQVSDNVTLHAGWFEHTLPAFLGRHEGPARLINVDCDMYSSTRTVLEQLAPRIVAGTVLVFDEYIGNAHWREDEFKAFQEAVAQYGWRYEYLCFSVFTKQVVVKILG